MTGKSRLIMTAMVITLIIMSCYTLYRADRMERTYAASLEKNFLDLSSQFSLLESRSDKGNIRPDQLDPFIESSVHILKTLALVAVINNEGTVISSAKNDTLVPAGPVHDEILTALTGEIPNKIQPLRVRYFKPVQEKDSKHMKMYLAVYQTPGHRLLAAYAYTPPKKELVSLVLELSLILLLSIIITTASYIVKKRIAESTDRFSDENDEVRTDTNEKTRIMDSLPLSHANDAGTETLSRLIFDLFKELHAISGPDSIALYLNQTGELLGKSYELKEKSFLRIDSQGFETFNLDSDIGRELRSSTPVILENNSKIMLPLVHETVFLGIIIIQRMTPFSAKEIADSRKILSRSSSSINGCIMVNRILVDRETGLLTEAGFEVRYNELIKAEKNKKRPFSLIIINPVNDDHLSDRQRIMMMQLISPAIKEKVPEDAGICLYRNMLAILLPDKILPMAAEISEAVVRNISRFRIKVENDRMVHIQPRAGIASTDSLVPGSNVRDQALENLKRTSRI